MEIYLVRHGQTLWNVAKRLQGHADIALTEQGRADARKTGEALKNVRIDRIYSSPLNRAYETAELIRGLREIPLVKDDRLIEICFGVKEGSVGPELMKDPDSYYRYFFEAPEKYRAPEGGEEMSEVCERTKQFMQEVIEPLADEGSCERVMITGHGAMNKGLMCYIKKHGVDQYWSGGLQKNCGIIVLDYRDGVYTVVDEHRSYCE